MTVRDLLTSGVKTAVQAGVALGVSALVNLGINVEAVQLENVVFTVVAGLVAVGLNKLGDKFPVVNQVLSFGLSGQSAQYN
jgi:hypothetical protein